MVAELLAAAGGAGNNQNVTSFSWHCICLSDRRREPCRWQPFLSISSCFVVAFAGGRGMSVAELHALPRRTRQRPTGIFHFEQSSLLIDGLFSVSQAGGGRHAGGGGARAASGHPRASATQAVVLRSGLAVNQI